MSLLDRFFALPQNITMVDPHVSNVIPQIFNQIDHSFKHKWDIIATQYLSFIRLLYTQFTQLELGAIHIDQIISINNWHKGVFLSPAFPNIMILSLLGDTTSSQQGFLNECGPLIRHYNIRLAKSDDINCLIMFDVPLRLYYPIIDAFFRNNMFMKWPERVVPKPSRRKVIKYYPSPFYNDTFRMIYDTYVKYLRAVAYKIFDIKNIATINAETMMTISNLLRYEYEHNIIIKHKPRKVIKFFKRVKIFNQIAEYRFHRNTTTYNKIHFWIRQQYLDIRIYKILKYHDNDTLQWFLEHTNTFKYLTEWRIERYEENIRKQKRKKAAELRLQQQIKPEPIQIKNEPVYYHNQWDNSYPVIRSGDENIDRQLRSIVSTFIEVDI